MIMFVLCVQSGWFILSMFSILADHKCCLFSLVYLICHLFCLPETCHEITSVLGSKQRSLRNSKENQHYLVLLQEIQ